MKKKTRYKTAAFQKKLKAQLRIVGKNLRMLRQMRKESLKTTAKVAGISASHLSRIERGLVPRFKITVLGLLCMYFNVKMSEVVVRSNKPKSE